ncbi:MAG: peptide ABC transporter substrate-binding protein [Bacillota bacterium]|nr:peptide ABC transporter substrate-binding protein [Bacillota bacterium]
MKRVFALALAFTMLLTVFSACGKTTASSDKTISVEIGSEPESVDPAFCRTVDGDTLVLHNFEGLAKLDKDGKPVLGMAESYTQSEDKKTYTFVLRKDAKWSDGQPVKAGDFEYAWKRAIDPKNAASYGYMFDVIKGGEIYYKDPSKDKYDINDVAVKALDDKTLKIELSAPCPYFMELLAYPTYAPVRKDIVDGNDSWATKPNTYVGNGPYKLVSWKHNSEMVYEKNQNYYDAANLGPDKIRFVLMSDNNAALAAFKKGDILFADDMPSNEIDAWKGKPEFHAEGELGTCFIDFNNTKKPFDDPRVRTALSLAIDRNYICDKIGKAGQKPAGAFVPIGMSGKDQSKEFRAEGGDYYPVDGASYQANVAKAKELLAAAGYPNGEGFPKFEYLYNTATGNKENAEAFQNMWKTSLNIDCTLQQQEWNVFNDTKQKGNYEVARSSFNSDYNDPISFLDMFTSDNVNNFCKYNNKQYDDLISQIKSSDDRNVRYTKMHEAEALLMKDMPIAPIYYNVDTYLISSKLKGVYSSPLGFRFFKYATIQY